MFNDYDNMNLNELEESFDYEEVKETSFYNKYDSMSRITLDYEGAVEEF